MIFHSQVSAITKVIECKKIILTMLTSLCLMLGLTVHAKGEKMQTKANLISHHSDQVDLSTVTNQIKKAIIERGEQPDATIQEQLSLLEQMSQFDFGRFLLIHRGINGFWTRHMVLYPKNKDKLAAKGIVFTPLEKWVLEKAPVVRATQERFIIFQRLLQENIKNNMTIASLPCGMMDDLLTLDFSNVSTIRLVGIDLDPNSITGAKETAKQLNLDNKASFTTKDAWQLGSEGEYDIITSNGLNIYEPNDEKVVELYQKFYTALKPNGILITSFLTPPPMMDPTSSWDMSKINPEDLKRQKVLFGYVANAKWQTFRTEEKTVQQLESAGFKEISIFYDQAKIFPTIMAKK